MSKDISDKPSKGEDAHNGAPHPEKPDEEAPEQASPEEAEPGKASGWAKGELEALREEKADLTDRLLRTAAEMENLRRRTERDKADTVKYAVSNFARDVLSIGDNIARAIAHVPEDAAEKNPDLKSFLEGIQVTERELQNVMERHGIARLDPKGERFDPNSHQAMFEVDNKDVPEGTIVEVIQPGYVIAERVLRPAMVGIAKGGPKVAKPAAAPAAAPPPKAANDDAAKPDAAAQSAPKAGDAKAKKGEGKGKKRVGGEVDKSA